MSPVHDELLKDYCINRDVGVRNQLMEKYIYIAKIVAKRFVGRGVEYDDLMQVASLALLKAIERFDYTREVKLASFAIPSIVGEIKNYFRDKTNIVHIPRRENELMRKMEKHSETLANELGRAPKPQELAEGLGVPIEKIYELKESQAARSTVSLDYTTGDDEPLAELVGGVEPQYQLIENADFFESCLRFLNEKERDFIARRYVQNKSQRVIAQEMDVSQMYVSRLEKRIMQKLRPLL